jgi:hypothetical protein
MRRPLVYATTAALRQDEALLPGRVLENEIEAAILAGRVAAGSHGGYVFSPAKT